MASRASSSTSSWLLSTARPRTPLPAHTHFLQLNTTVASGRRLAESGARCWTCPPCLPAAGFLVVALKIAGLDCSGKQHKRGRHASTDGDEEDRQSQTDRLSALAKQAPRLGCSCARSFGELKIPRGRL